MNADAGAPPAFPSRFGAAPKSVSGAERMSAVRRRTGEQPPRPGLSERLRFPVDALRC